VAVQTRRLNARSDIAGDAVVGVGFVLVAHGAGRPLHTPLPDDERAGAFRNHSSSTRKWLLLPSLCSQTDARFVASGSKRQWLSGSFNVDRLGSGYPGSSDNIRTA
jgi:hypothetical protein